MLQSLQDEYGLYLTPEGVEICINELKQSSKNASTLNPTHDMIYKHVLSRSLKGVSAPVFDSKVNY